MKINRKQIIGSTVGILGLIIPFFLNINGLSEAGHVTLGVFFLAAAFWMLEPVPIYATSMLVIFLQVVLLSKEGLFFHSVTDSYTPDSYTAFIGTLANPIIILFLGGFILADAAVKYSLDRNITRILLKPFGTSPKFIVLGLMVVTAVLSGFMSNTATTAMMMTVILPIIARVKNNDPLRIGLALSIPFAANIGGIATPIGTPPNAVVLGALNQQGITIAFGEWMVLAVPLVVVALLMAWFILTQMFKAQTDHVEIDMSGRFNTSKNAILLYVVFGITVLLWITEKAHGMKSAIIALIPVVFLTMTKVITKDDIRKLPWEVLWLVAGGLSLGISMKSTGLAEWIIGSISWSSFGPLLIIIMFGSVCLLIANFLSHTVTATLIVPLAVSLATSGLATEGFDLVIVSIVIGISASLAMMLPISTPPNAIAMSTGTIETSQMAKAGITIGLLSLGLVILNAVFYWPIIL